MPKIRALSPEEAKRTLAHRLSPLADRLNQLFTKFGIAPYRVFLTWTKWTGLERGEGDERLFRRIEILPTPELKSLDAVSFSVFHAGTVPVGSVKLERISNVTFTADILLGKAFPDDPLPFGEDAGEKHIPEPYEFFYEIVEDGRGDDPPKRARFRPMNMPLRRADQTDFTIMLERVSQDRTRADKSAIGTGLE